MQTHALRRKSVHSSQKTKTQSVADSSRNVRSAKIVVQQALRSPSLQAKLKVGPRDDVHEREADRVADEVMRMPEPVRDAVPAARPSPGPPPSIQRTCPDCREERKLQRQAEPSPDEEVRLSGLEEEKAEDLIRTKSLDSPPIRIQRLCARCRARRNPVGDSLRPAVSNAGRGQSSSGRTHGPEGDSLFLQRRTEGDTLLLQRKSLLADELRNVRQSKALARSPDRIQRRCAGCEEESLQRQAEDDEMRLRRKPAAAAESENDEETLRTSPSSDRADAALSPDVEAGIRSLRGGGRPLGGSARGFFESRFRRDFGSVRVHDGERAADLASSVNARAFTLGTDIVFGRGQFSPSTRAGRTLIAHELTHVLQQNPSILRSKPASGVDRRPAGGQLHSLTSASPEKLQPKLYWEPASMNGTKTHEAVLEKIRDKNSGHIFVEAPIPHATKAGFGAGFKYGFADLIRVSGFGKRAFGVRFTDSESPLPVPAPTRRFNKAYLPIKSAPRTDGKGGIANIGLGATTVKIADLKPAPASPSGTRGKKQIQNYQGGLKHTRDLSNKWAKKKGVKEWALKDGNLQFWTDITVPETLSGSKFHNQPLVVKEFTWQQSSDDKQHWLPSKAVYKPPVGATQVRGFLKLNKAKHGIIQYRWAPSFPYSRKTLTASVSHLSDKEVGPLLRDLHTIEVKKVQGKLHPSVGGAAMRARGLVQRKRSNVKVNTKVADKFDLAAWTKKRWKLSQKYQPLRRIPEVSDRRTARFLIEADKDAGNPDGLASNRPIAADLVNIKRVKKLDLWTDMRKAAPVRLLGRLRKTFGRTFVAVANRIHSVRNRIRGLLEKRRAKPKPNSYAAVAILAIWRVAVAILTPVFRSTLAALTESLRLGVKSRLEPRLKALVDPDKLLAAAQAQAGAAVKENFPELFAIVKKIEAARTTIQGKVDEFEKRFGKELRQLESLTEKARTVGSIIQVAMIAVQCATPPLWGCLKLLASTLIARLANKVMQWCSVQKSFQNLALKVSFLQKLPKQLAETFIKVLPTQIQEFFDRGPIDALTAPKPADLKDCNPKGHPKGSREPTRKQKAYADLMVQLGCGVDRESAGCAKFRALMDLMKKQGVGAREIAPAEIRALGPLLKNDEIKSSDIREAARVQGPSKKATAAEFLKSLPKQLQEAGGRNRRVAAFGKFFKSESQALRSGLPIGAVKFDPSNFNAETMASRKIANVAILVRTSNTDFAAGSADVTLVGPFRCVSETQLQVKRRLSNVRLSDRKGKPVALSLEKGERVLVLTVDKERMKPIREKVCP